PPLRTLFPYTTLFRSSWASLAFALAAMTKNQFSLILLPTLVALFVLDRLHHRQLRVRDTLLPALAVLSGVAVWYLVQLLPLLGRDRKSTRLTPVTSLS